MAASNIRYGIFPLVLLLFQACTLSHTAPVTRPQAYTAAAKPVLRYHHVQRGETLSSIARHYGYSYGQLAAWNRVKPPYTIYPGQKLRLAMSAGATISVKSAQRSTAAPALPVRPAPPPMRQTAMLPLHCRPGGQWQWPARGAVQSVQGTAGKHALNIFGQADHNVYAAAPGEVVYSGPEPGLNGRYTQLVILEHNRAYRSVYAHNRRVWVREGEQVAAGQRIAEMGAAAGQRSLLRFELRCHSRTVNPLHYLPRT